VNVRGGNEISLAGFGHRPRWSPDGKRLLIASQTGRGDWTDKHAYVLTLDGRANEILPEFFKGVVKSPSVAWQVRHFPARVRVRHQESAQSRSPCRVSGVRPRSKCVHRQDASGKEPKPPAITERDLATGNEYLLSDTVGPWTDLPQFPRWSPDGRFVTYVRRGDRDGEGRLTSHHPELVVLDTQTRHERVVPAASGYVIRTAWDFSPDGDWIAVDATRKETLDTGPAQVVLYSLSSDATGIGRGVHSADGWNRL
jgi:Tol biopolymer transport system component